MYQTDFACTYKQLLNYKVCDGSNNDCEGDSDALYQVQFLQAFGCDNGYDDRKITDGMKTVRQILESHSEGQAFLDEAFKQGLPPSLAIFATLGGEEKNAMIDTILRTYYGWPTMDLIHSFVCKIKKATDTGDNATSLSITRNDWENIIIQHKKLYSC